MRDRPFGAPPDKPSKRSKYNVDRSPAGIAKRTVDDIVFASEREAARYGELRLLEKAGYIRQLELQPAFKFEIDGKLMFKYVSDFRYFEGAMRVCEDVKGVKTAVYKLKKRIIEAHFNVRITEVA